MLKPVALHQALGCLLRKGPWGFILPQGAGEPHETLLMSWSSFPRPLEPLLTGTTVQDTAPTPGNRHMVPRWGPPAGTTVPSLGPGLRMAGHSGVLPVHMTFLPQTSCLYHGIHDSHRDPPAISIYNRPELPRAWTTEFTQTP